MDSDLKDLIDALDPDNQVGWNPAHLEMLRLIKRTPPAEMIILAQKIIVDESSRNTEDEEIIGCIDISLKRLAKYHKWTVDELMVLVADSVKID